MEITFTSLSEHRWSAHGTHHNLLGVVEYTPTRGCVLWADCYYALNSTMMKEIVTFCESQEKIEKEKNAGVEATSILGIESTT